jgi:hypothetical protein
LREPTLVKDMPADKVSQKQYLLLGQLSEHLLHLLLETIRHVFINRLANLKHFIETNTV